jgi:lipoic acid synthetase
MEYVRKPEWLKVKLGGNTKSSNVHGILKRYGLNTVCNEAGCPNLGECFSRGTATFMILGKNCTRNCRFCKVTKDEPEHLNHMEPKHIAEAVKEMGLTHTVITSVTRDDLPDGGAEHFANTILEIRKLNPEVTIEVLIPDFKGDYDALKKVVEAKPDIINHNVETVPDLYSLIRPMAIFERSLEVLKRVKEMDSSIFTKSGFMVGLGEKEEQVLRLLEDLRTVDCDVVTIGQYLQPSKAHINVVEYVTPEQFKKYEDFSRSIGFKYVASGPLVRSSYHAEDEFNGLKV